MTRKREETAVVVVTYNGKKYVEFCIGSIVKSDANTHVFAVDNNSKDGTDDLIEKKYPKVEIIRNEKNIGFGKANNIAIKRALKRDYEYIFLINQDASVEKSTISKLVKTHKSKKDIGVLSPLHMNGSGDDFDPGFSKYVKKFAPELKKHLIKRDLKKPVYFVEFVNAASWMMSAHTIEKVGGFDPIFSHGGEDVNYLDRVRYNGLKVAIEPEAKIYHDRGQGRTGDIESYVKSIFCDPNKDLDRMLYEFSKLFYEVIKREKDKKHIDILLEDGTRMIKRWIRNRYFNDKYMYLEQDGIES